jgi:hypothetical protein
MALVPGLPGAGQAPGVPVLRLICAVAPAPQQMRALRPPCPRTALRSIAESVGRVPRPFRTYQSAQQAEDLRLPQASRGRGYHLRSDLVQ